VGALLPLPLDACTSAMPAPSGQRGNGSFLHHGALVLRNDDRDPLRSLRASTSNL